MVVSPFLFSKAIHQPIDGMHFFTTLFKLYDAPGKMASSQVSVRMSLLTRRSWAEFRVSKAVLYLFGHCRAGSDMVDGSLTMCTH